MVAASSVYHRLCGAEGGRKLFVIQAASGSGKSSFLRAGLLPRLEREDRDFFTLPLLRPGTAALSGKTGLAASLEHGFKQLGQLKPLGELLAELALHADALPPLLNQIQVLAIQRLVGDAKPQIDRPPTLVLAIDQAEELFAMDDGLAFGFSAPDRKRSARESRPGVRHSEKRSDRIVSSPMVSGPRVSAAARC